MYSDPSRSGSNYVHYITASNSTHIFYVPRKAPNQLWSVAREDLSHHTLLYEAEAGAITNLSTGAYQYTDTALQLVAGNRQYIWLDLTTGAAEVRMEQYYIRLAFMDLQNTVTTPREGEAYFHDETKIYFYGSPTSGGELSGYVYYRDVERCTPVHY